MENAKRFAVTLKHRRTYYFLMIDYFRKVFKLAESTDTIF